MNKKKTAITIIVSILLMIIVSCSDINPFFAGGVVPGGNWIYFAEGSEIKKIRLDGSEVTSVFSSGLSGIMKIQLDPFKQRIYILRSGGEIYEYDLDGKGKKEISSVDYPEFYDMTLDYINGYIYLLTGVNSESIVRVDISTYQFDVIYNEDLDTASVSSISSITSDNKGQVYFTCDSGRSIRKLDNLSSSSQIEYITSPPTGFNFNRVDSSIYFNEGVLIRKLITTTNISSNVSDVLIGINEIVVQPLESRLFFLHDDMAGEHDFYTLNLDGSGINEIFSGSIDIFAFDILSK